MYKFRIAPQPPFDFGLSVGCMTYFHTRHAADEFADGVLRRVLSPCGKLVLACVRSTGSIDTPQLEVRLTPLPEHAPLASDALAEAHRQLRWMLGVDGDIAPFYEMAQSDPQLAPLVGAMRGLRPMRTPTAYEALVLAILGQQVSTHVARMLRNLLIETYGEQMPRGDDTLYAFPQPATIAAAGVERLRSIKFSRRKAEYIVDISAQVADGSLRLDGLRGLPDDEVIARLTALRGVGPWTAHWMLIRALGHPDGFPSGDLALQRMMGTLAGDGTPMTPADALAYSERWSPYRSYVTTYLFGAARAGRLAEFLGQR